MVFRRRVKIALSLILSYCVASFLIFSLYPQKTAIPNWVRFTIVTNTYKEQVVQIAQSILTFKLPHLKDTSLLVAEQIYPTPINTAKSFDFQSIDQTADVVFQTASPTPNPTPPLLLPSVIPDPTEFPPIPTDIFFPLIPSIARQHPTIDIPPPNELIDTPVPTQKPTITPSPIAVPTTTPLPPVDASLIVTNPLGQPYYQPSAAYKCYTASRMIQLYGNNASKANCYSAVQSAINSQIVSISLLGRAIQVHKRVLPAFQAVSKELDRYPHSSGSYTFPSKSYRIETEGAYVFRCNVNASTSGRNDICSSGCVLSMHSFGIAVDINYEGNCNGCSNYDMPKEIYETFEKYGFRWGGRYKSIFNSTIDAMHFEYLKEACEGY
ncbi:MAG: M15 family metallopeptidase [bacterium]